MTGLLQDLRYGARLMARSPGFTLIAVLTLGLGIGANSAIFSVVDAVLLQPLPFPEPERLVMLWEHVPRHGWEREPLSYPDFTDWKERVTSTEGMAAVQTVRAILTGAGEPERLAGAAVSADLFPVLGVAPALGRAFLAEEDRPGAEPVAVIGHGLWTRRFGARPDVVGAPIRMDGRSVTVVGVMPEGFNFPMAASATDYWVPLASDPLMAARLTRRGTHSLSVVARLKRGVGVAQAESELDAIAADLERQFPDTNNGFGSIVVPLQEELVREARAALLILQAAVGLVLLIACANIASLLLARAAAREREIAIRAALGAGRLRIVRQLLAESVLLATAGGLAGLFVGTWGVDLLLSLAPAPLPPQWRVGLDARVMGFTAGLSLLAGLLAGLAPALRAAGRRLEPALREAGRGAVGAAGEKRARGILVVSEVALSLTLLVGAGLLIRSLGRLLEVDPGFDPRGVLTMNVALPVSSYPDGVRQAAFFRDLTARLQTLPTTQACGAVFTLPLSGSNCSNSFTIPGRDNPDDESRNASFRSITPDYLKAMGIPLRRGRGFTERDDARAPRVALINDTFARRFFTGADPIGRHVAFDDDDPDGAEIVGVVGDVKYGGLDGQTEPEYYLPYGQSPQAVMTLVVRARGEAPGLAAVLREAARDLDPDQPLATIRPMEEYLDRSIASRRFPALLLGAFGLTALLLTAIGLHGVLAYSVARRTGEIGVRMALGAGGRDILALVLRQGMSLALAGAAVGLAAAFALTRFLSSLLFGVTATDPIVFIGVPVLLLAVAALACVGPARRALRLDPVAALRAE